MTNSSLSLDRAFHALADPARRTAVSRLCNGPLSVTELFAPTPLSRTSMLQHVRVLEASGLLRSEKVGRVRRCHLNRPAVRAVTDWLDAQRRVWEARLDGFDAYVATLANEEPPP